ncbi:PfkB family carbohydrate kinase [Leucobacter allii]|uniref:PfkB family carbohydrate kinase n=1 Tax=Leucobacter allii TaxID=2932247 RepID=A0ABY4FGI2_9MICO|nr:PfkB family carbohydrate kinase [Leucobacter allii]UOQ55793.1 PfkB family carbohydrate kinase [Leucobacter allii]
MTGRVPDVVVSGYASVDYALQIAPFEGHDATTLVRSRADEWPRMGGVAHVTRAAALAAQGAARVRALSWVGADAAGEAWTRAVADAGADTTAVSRRGTRTPNSHLLYPEGQGTICLFDPGDCHPDELSAEQSAVLADAGLLVATIGPAAATLAGVRAVDAACRVMWVVKQDPSSLTEELAAVLARRASVVTLSEGESAVLGTVAALARPGTLVVVTHGARGAELLEIDAHGTAASRGRVPATPVSGVDTTGAGDTFSGTLAGLLAAHDDPTPEAALALIARASAATGALLAARAANAATAKPSPTAPN